MKKFVFATNYNEGEDFLSFYIDNFLSYTDEQCVLVINLAPGRRLVSCPQQKSDRVHIFSGEVQRAKWGMGIALGHLESFAYAAHYCGPFDFFCTVASNALFFRSIDKDAIIDRLDRGEIFPQARGRDYRTDHDIPVTGHEAENGTWAWRGFNQSVHFRECLAKTCQIEHCTVTQIEGLVARRDDWDMILKQGDALHELRAALAQDPDDPRYYMAVEEMIFSSLILQHGSGRYTHLCYMLWEGLGRIGPRELIADLPRMPSYLCCAKWFERSIHDPGAVLVCTPAGRALLDACRTGSAASRSSLLSQLGDALEALGRSNVTADEETGIAVHWRDLPGWSGRLLTEGVIHLDRQIETIIPDIIDPKERFAPFFLTEAMHVDFDLSVALSDLGDELQVTLTGVFPHSPRSTALAGYLYLSARQPVSEFILSWDTHERAAQVADKIVLFDNLHRYELVTPDRESRRDGAYCLHYAVKDEWKHRCLSVGLPCYGRQVTATRIAVLETIPQYRVDESSLSPALMVA